jgi:hypothetical protein
MALCSLAGALLLAGAHAAPPLASGPWGNRNPVANPGAVVSAGSARFTVLTERLIRMEYAADEDAPVFEDRATVAIINRNLPLVEFAQSHNGAHARSDLRCGSSLNSL